MKQHFNWLWALSTVLLCACSAYEPREAKEIFQEQQSGVCMVLNSYYYAITLPDGTEVFCSGIDEEGDLEGFTTDRDEAIKNRSMSFGTAFFIDKDGTLLTNRHVAAPYVPEQALKTATENLMGYLRNIAQLAQQEYSDKFNALEQQKSQCYSYDYWSGYTLTDPYTLSQIEEQQQELANNYRELQELVDEIDNMDMSRIRIESVNELGIAYNNTYVTKEEDFLEKTPCIVTRVSSDENVDLALLRLKDKKTPDNAYIFKIKGVNPDPAPSLWERIVGLFGKQRQDAMEIGLPLVMIGYNAGPVLGNTKEGILAQMTEGTVSQKPDGERILYSIPSLAGSSGSPVLDKYGYVRAVNFAKVGDTQSFNFGIPAKQIQVFLQQSSTSSDPE